MAKDKDDDKTHQALQQEAADRAEAARQADSEEALADAEDRAAQAERQLGVIEGQDVAPEKVKGKGAGTDPDYTDSESLHDHHISEGQAPLDPGPEQPVDPDEAAQAKEQRGR